MDELGHCWREIAVIFLSLGFCINNSNAIDAWISIKQVLIIEPLYPYLPILMIYLIITKKTSQGASPRKVTVKSPNDEQD